MRGCATTRRRLNHARLIRPNGEAVALGVPWLGCYKARRMIRRSGNGSPTCLREARFSG
jgi:hypothetical protein